MNAKGKLENVIWKIVEDKLSPAKLQRLAQAILDAGFVRIEDVEIDKKKIKKIIKEGLVYEDNPIFVKELATTICQAKGILRVKK